MEKVKDRYLEEIADIPEKVALENEIESPGIEMSGNAADEDLAGLKSGSVYETFSNDNVIPDNPQKLSENFRQKIKKSVPSDFDLSQIGKIDLKEAEKIANEEIIFLSEEDLIEGLEDFELIPLKEFSEIEKPAGLEIQKPAVIITRQPDEVENKSSADYNDVLFESFAVEESSDNEELISDTEPSEIPGADNPLPVGEVDEFAENETTAVENPDTQTIEDLPEIIEIAETEIIPVIEEPITIPDENNDLDSPDSAVIDNVVIEEAVSDFPGEELSDNMAEIEPLLTENVINNQITEVIKINDISENEELPDKYTEIHKKHNVKFVDDRYILRMPDISVVSEKDPLTARLARIIDIVKGKSYIVESDIDYLKNVYTLEDQKVYDYDDNVIYEEKFISDTDFEFIDNSIIKEDFIHYIQEIDEYLDEDNRPSISEISEIMGFAKEDGKFFEEKLFGDYYKDIDIDSEIEFINPNLDFFNRNITEVKNLTYFLDDPHSLKNEERKSIEADLSSESAIVFEENIKEIELMLGDTFAGEYHGAEKVFEEKHTAVEEEIGAFEDITDKVIILDDFDNVSQFMETIPDKKDDLAKLLAYLDGLFEKLPEDAVRKFAESEYFDLYVKVLKELGI